SGDEARRRAERAQGTGGSGGASGRWLITFACLVAAPAAVGGDACNEERGATGLGVVVQAGAVVIADVAPESIGARAGFRTGDVVLQANDVVPRTCSQWARAIGAARDGDKALLVLVRRGEAEVPLGLGAATWRAPGLARGPVTAPPSEGGQRPSAPPPSAPAPATVRCGRVAGWRAA